LEIDLWELFPDDLKNLFAVLLLILLQVAKESSLLVARPERRPRPPENPQPAAMLVPRDDVSAVFAILLVTRYSVCLTAV
jgi:hypothetical protein